ncbi:MAG: HEAT repeat domain-containing protein [Gemmatimonadota bacterium]
MTLSRFSRLLGVRPRELARVAPLTAAYGLVMASLYVLKPVRNALFLDQQGIGQLPYVLMLVALVGGAAAVVFSRFAASVRLDRLIVATYLVLTGCLLAFRLVLTHGWAWSCYLFYVWVNLYGLMATSLIWLLANAVFNAREGRRLFGFIGTAGIAGAVIGGVFTSRVVPFTGTENLLLVCAAMLAGALLLLYPVRACEFTEPRAAEGEAAGIAASLRGSELLQLLGGMAAMAAVVAAIIDVQFNQIVDHILPDKDAKTAFFGQFFALLSAFAFVFQVVVTPRVLRSLGVIPALVFLPVTMAIGSVGVLFLPGLAAAVLAKLGDGGFRHSIHKSATELLYLPVPPEVKKRTKVLLDTTVDNVATGLGAAIVLVALSVAGLSYRHLSYLSLTLVALWLGLIVRSRRAYVDAFRRAIERRQIDLSEYTVDIAEAATLESLINALESRRAGPAVYALEMLAHVRAARLVAPVTGLLDHAVPEVRWRALQVLANQASDLPLARAEAMQEDAELQVRVEALHLLCTHAPGDRLQRLRRALASGDLRHRTAATGFIAEYGTEAEQDLIDEAFVRHLFADAGRDGGLERAAERVHAARLIGTLYEPVGRPYLQEALHRLMADPEPEVVRQTISSLGQLRRPEFQPWLLERLDEWHYRRVARAALAAYGPTVLPLLKVRISDESMSPLSRGRAARVVADIRSQESVKVLLDCLDSIGPQVQYAVIKSLSKLRGTAPELTFDPRRVTAALRRAAAADRHLLEVLALLESGAEPPPVRLLVRALREKQAECLERIFRLLGLLYPPRDMHDAYLGLVSGGRATRASSLEFLDNLLSRELKELLVPLLDADAPAAARDPRGRPFGAAPRDRGGALTSLLRSDDPWLRACATFSLSGEPDRAEELGRPMRDDPHPLVRETACLVLGEGR